MNLNMDVQVWHIVLAVVTALWGGIVGYITYLKNSQQNHSWLKLFMHLSMSGFAGMLCWLGCMYLVLNGYLTAMLSGLAGYMGIEFVHILQERFTDKLNKDVQNDTTKTPDVD